MSEKQIFYHFLTFLSRLLAHLYAAESLVLLDKISEALEHLNPENVKDISFDLPPDESNSSSSEEGLIKAKPPPSKTKKRNA